MPDQTPIKWTPERREVLARDFTAGVDIHAIKANLDALPGAPVGDIKRIAAYAHYSLRVSRPVGWQPLARIKGTPEALAMGRQVSATKLASTRTGRIRSRSRPSSGSICGTDLARSAAHIEQMPHAPNRKSNFGETWRERVAERHAIGLKILRAMRQPDGPIPPPEDTEAWIKANPDKITVLPAGWADY